MADLIFPSELEAQYQEPVAYEFGPQTRPYATTNNLTYTYDLNKNAWVLKQGQVVTEDALEVYLKGKLDKTGGQIFGADRALSFSETALSDGLGSSTLALRTDGSVYFNGSNKTLVFNDVSTQGSADIYVDSDDEEDKVLSFASGGIVSYSNFNFASNSPNTLLSHTKNSENDFVIFDLNSGGSYGGQNIVALPTDNALIVRSGGTDVVTIDTKGGHVAFRPIQRNSPKTIVVTQTQDSGDAGADVFRVDTDTHKVYTSLDYSLGLIAGSEGAIVSGNSAKIAFDEPNLVATVGYVREGFFKPGMNVFASSEGQVSEVGGMWTDNNNFYIVIEAS